MTANARKKLQYRYENFGGIIASQKPAFLAFVDREYMRQMGLGESELWAGDEAIDKLSAPTEVHFSITNRCSGKCRHCYMDAGQADEGELNTADMKRAIDVLARMKVFHIALGGGEALEREDLFEIAGYARAKGIVPNLTVSGMGIDEDTAERLKVFGQINVSIDGVGENYPAYRGRQMFESADRALEVMVKAGIATGINCVVGRSNFDHLEEIFAYAAGKKLNEIEFLRLKPSGRGLETYLNSHTTYEQNIELAPRLSMLSRKYAIAAKIDCSFVPMFCYHNPPMEALEAIATYGCEAGNVLLGIRSNGLVSGCSFLKSTGLSVFELEMAGESQTGYGRITEWLKRPPEPCASCKYLKLCKGGCHAVSEFVKGDFNCADPGCPRVVEYCRGGAK